MATPVSWNGLARRTSISSHHTAMDYLELLEHSFVLHIVPFYDVSARAFRWKKNKKLYFADPFIAHAFRWWARRPTAPFALSQEALADPIARSKLVEGVVGSHLKRAHPRVGYWRDRYGNEVDFVSETPQGIEPVEVKFREQMGPKDFRALQKLGRGMVLTRTRFERRDDFLLVPTALYVLQCA